MYRIAELERITGELCQDLRGLLELAERRISNLESQTPQARELQLEADLAAADLAESGNDRHGPGCKCPACPYITPQCASGQHLCSGCDCGCHIERDEPELEESW